MIELGERVMRRFPRLFLFLVLAMVLLTAACGAEGEANPTMMVGTLLPENNDLTGTPFAAETSGTGETATAIATGTAMLGLETPTLGVTDSAATQAVGTPGATRTAVIPVTGQEIMLVECQFCVDTRAHALLVLPDTATFNITSPALGATTSNTTAVDAEPRCTTVEVNNGRQVVLCSGPEMTPLVVNICTDASTCTDFPVDLLACPLSQGNQTTPNQTNNTPDNTGNTTVTETATPLSTSSTPTITVSTPTP
jgi:hypothetical protein